MKSLVLTLGHNSSAILIEDGNIVCGYEEERLTGIKSDSAYPENAINRLCQLNFIPENVDVYISHWFLDGQLPSNDLKHWDESKLRQRFPKATVHGLVDGVFTHHDAHALSAEVFAGSDFPKNHHILVADGFGTSGECYSAYSYDGKSELKVGLRYHGFSKSIGLFYQYATEYCQMVPHQHEYKMLAFETHLTEIMPCPYRVRALDQYIDKFSKTYLDRASWTETDLAHLAYARDNVRCVLDTFIDFVKANDMILSDIKDLRSKRILISYFVQRHAENVVRSLVEAIRPTNLIVAGGVFFNVKINKMVCDMIPGKFCAMPLAGDQGAGLGVYQYYNGDLKWPDHLFWGHRDVIKPEAIGITLAESTFDVIEELRLHGIVNIVRGPMEFGPRALCHTTTLAKPTRELAARINKMNDRTNEMPFALVVTRKQAYELFEGIDKIHKSLEYMIVTRRFKPGRHSNYVGGAHYYPLTKEYTCRPQITDDPFMVRILEEFGPLINTSFNYHGCPIVYDEKQIIHSHNQESKRYPIATFIFNSEE